MRDDDHGSSDGKDLSWREAAMEVLGEQPGEGMHYTEIADAIAQRGLVRNPGATPAVTLATALSNALRDVDSPFFKVSRGYYALKRPQAGYEIKSAPSAPAVPPAPETRLINAFGMYWDRHHVRWERPLKILGQQPGASITVDFSAQRGVYILYDRHKIIYVGRAERDSLGTRLRAHVSGRLASRWDRFSWFGVYRAREDGTLDTGARVRGNDTAMLIATMEALLIETLEPPQNRARGEDLRAVEFWQVKDPDLKKDELIETARLLRRSMREINRRE